jgi:DNA-binding CsgD family transcriptional regulator
VARPTLSRLRIPTHWLVLRSTVESIPDRNASPAWHPPSEQVAPVLRRGAALMINKRDFLPSASASEVGLRNDGGRVLQITPSERYALQLVAKRVPKTQIGAMLGLAPADIDLFLGALFRRLGATSRACAVRVASRRGLLVPSLNGPAIDLVATESDEHTQPPRATATRTGMSLKTVQLIVGRLVTDEEYRLTFLSDPTRALTMLRDQGVELTAAELDALVRTDRTLWSDAAARIDPDLQRSSWLAD